MSLIDNRLVPGNTSHPRLATPVKVWVDNHALGHERRAVAFVKRQIFQLRSNCVAEALWRPADLPCMRACVRVEHKLVGIESVPGRRFVGPMDPESVDTAWVYIQQIPMPDLVGVFGQC